MRSYFELRSKSACCFASALTTCFSRNLVLPPPASGSGRALLNSVRNRRAVSLTLAALVSLGISCSLFLPLAAVALDSPELKLTRYTPCFFLCSAFLSFSLTFEILRPHRPATSLFLSLRAFGFGHVIISFICSGNCVLKHSRLLSRAKAHSVYSLFLRM